MKKIVCLFIVIITISSFAHGISISDECIDKMVLGGFITGDENGLKLEKTLTRAEASVMILRIIGAQNDALEKTYKSPFDDVPSWADSAVSYLYAKGYVHGISEHKFGSSDTVSAEQFYTMLLRALGYNDETYKSSLDYSLKIGLLKDKPISFTRDNAVAAMYNTLCFVKPGSSSAYCEGVASHINSSYTKEISDVILGKSKVYNALIDSYYAMNALDSYTMTQKGSYEAINKANNTKVSDRYVCTVKSDFTEMKTQYETNMKTTESGKITVKSQTLYANANFMCLKTAKSGEETTFDIINDNIELLTFDYASVHASLFSPDNTYISNYDCSETNDFLILKGYNFRYDLLYDITSDAKTDFYYNMEIKINKKNKLIESASITYNDIWKTSDDKLLDVNYKVDFKFSDINQTKVVVTDSDILSKINIIA